MQNRRFSDQWELGRMREYPPTDSAPDESRDFMTNNFMTTLRQTRHNEQITVKMKLLYPLFTQICTTVDRVCVFLVPNSQWTDSIVHSCSWGLKTQKCGRGWWMCVFLWQSLIAKLIENSTSFEDFDDWMIFHILRVQHFCPVSWLT